MAVLGGSFGDRKYFGTFSFGKSEEVLYF